MLRHEGRWGTHRQQGSVPLFPPSHLGLNTKEKHPLLPTSSPGYFCYLCCLRHEVVGVRVVVKLFIIIRFSAVVFLLAQPRATHPRRLCGC